MHYRTAIAARASSIRIDQGTFLETGRDCRRLYPRCGECLVWVTRRKYSRGSISTRLFEPDGDATQRRYTTQMGPAVGGYTPVKASASFHLGWGLADHHAVTLRGSFERTYHVHRGVECCAVPFEGSGARWRMARGRATHCSSAAGVRGSASLDTGRRTDEPARGPAANPDARCLSHRDTCCAA